MFGSLPGEGAEVRICLTSDIHHPRSHILPGRLPDLVREADPDVFAIAGDLCDGVTREFRRCLSHFGDLEMPKCLVLGNHDLWLRDGWFNPRDSEAKIERLLDMAEKEAGFHPLWRSPMILDGIAIAGNVGWYDYGFRSLPLPTEVYRRKTHLGYVWNDLNFIRWQYSDEEFNHLCLDRMGRHLAELQERDDVRAVVVVTHHIPFADCVQRKGIETFDFFNAYMGSPLTGDLIRRHSKIRAVAFGHSHGKGIPDRRQCRFGRLTAHNVSVDFDDPKPFLIDMDTSDC